MVRARSSMSRKNVQNLWELLKQRTHCRNPKTSNSHWQCWRMMLEASPREMTCPSLRFFLKNVFFLVLSFLHSSLINWSLTEMHLFSEAWFDLSHRCKSSWESKFFPTMSRLFKWCWAVIDIWSIQFTIALPNSQYQCLSRALDTI